MSCCIYLRKSRKDAEAEARGEEETLRRHERALLELAERLSLPVGAIYREVVSGETIAARPVMRRLLAEVERGLWDGVLVMEVERLARGDTVDQGVVARTFRFAGTKIITPMKTYDPADEFDEEYFEFGLFMSRREYKVINRRLQRGRLASVREGKYVGSRPPYGYRRQKLEDQKGYTLTPAPEEAELVRLLFLRFTRGETAADGTVSRPGLSGLCGWLNAAGFLSPGGGRWTASGLRALLTNPVYAGYIRWNRRKTVKTAENGRVCSSRPRAGPENWVLAPGLHPSLVDEETFRLAARLLDSAVPASRGPRSVRNPLAGLVVCGECGRKLVRRPCPGGEDALLCPTPGCPTVSGSLAAVERAVTEALSLWLKGTSFRARLPRPFDSRAEERACLKGELRALDGQAEAACELAERRVYSPERLALRLEALAARRKIILAALGALEPASGPEPPPDSPPRPETLDFSALYRLAETPEEKKRLLQTVLLKIVYTKRTRIRWNGGEDTTELTLYPLLPRGGLTDTDAVPTN